MAGFGRFLNSRTKDNVMKVLNIMYNIWWTRKKNIFQHHNTSNTEAILYMNQIIKKCTKNSWNKGENKTNTTNIYPSHPNNNINHQQRHNQIMYINNKNTQHLTTRINKSDISNLNNDQDSNHIPHQ